MGRKIIITVLSTFRKKKDGTPDDPITYKGGGINVEANWTNEAGLRYLLKKDEYTDIIYLCSEATSSSEYKDRIEKIVEPYGIKMTDVPYSINDDVKDISRKLTEKFEFHSSDTVYIDTTGGFRTITYYLVYLFRYLEYIGVRVESAIYSQIEMGKNEGIFKNVKDNFRMFDLINGAHEFTSTGNPRTLKEYFRSSGNKTIKNLLKAMQKFYDQISLCRIGEELDKSLTDMERCLRKIEENSDPSDDEARLKEIIPVIREKFFSFNKSRYLGLMKWCINNGLLQQALTLYVEKMPKAYFKELDFLCDDDVIDFSEDGIGHPENKGHDMYHDYFLKIIDRVSVPNVRLDMEHISHKDIKKLCFDYIYMKIVRNYVNHASEKNYKSYNERNREQMLVTENPSLYKFPNGNNFAAEDIKTFMRQSVQYIEEINVKK